MKLLIGIDDTDNLTSRGTGYIARQLLSYLSDKNIITPEIILRHQLLVDDRIPYTSHNSSASLKGELKGSFEETRQLCIDFLIQHSADGSDVGLCIVPEETNNKDVLVEWGNAAKTEVLSYEDALKLAEKTGVFLTGLTGEKTGIIGSLAAVGLHLSRNDGRVLWIKGLRETEGIFSSAEIKKLFQIELISTIFGEEILPQEKVYLSDWTRPVMKNGSLTLFVEHTENEKHEYQTASKHFIKSVSEQNISTCC
jgi:hypothetical protein